jgi:hypothetical protein
LVAGAVSRQQRRPKSAVSATASIPHARIIPSQWGFCFAGNEGAFCGALDAAVETQPEGKRFVYFEIGIGHGDCLKAVAEYLEQWIVHPDLDHAREAADGIMDFELHGVDVPTYSGHALRAAEMGRAFTRMELHLVGAEAFFKKWRGGSPDFVFIDACHGKACVKRDFYGVEPLVRPGGVVAFHDTDPECQGLHFQPHCETGIAARAAVDELGLLDGSRKGWRKIGETTGDKARGGHGCLFVQKSLA